MPSQQSRPQPLDSFTKVKPSVYIYQSSSTTPSDANAPDIVVFLSWSGASLKHIAKYMPGYMSLYPRSQIILITSAFTDFLSGSRSCDYSELGPAVEAIAAEPTARVLIHLCSNGGSHKLWRLASLFQKSQGHLLPMHALLLDSAPGKATFARSYAAISHELPKVGYFRIPSTILLFLFLCCFAVVMEVTRRTNTVDMVWNELNTPDLIGTNAARRYIYSREDSMVWDKDVEDHADEAEAKGYRVRLEKFSGSAHVAHMMADRARYWKIVEDLWADVQP
ncbi:hypothetical protein MMC19_007229 [Ptychographa xylographoides]|nr:hypothetical protein [Ptychographa xylographoides]